MSGYKVNVRPQHERVSLISAFCAESKKTVESWDVHENKPESLPVITVPLDIPLYRMANGRTQTDQLAYLAEHNLPPDFFSANEENATAQQAQHKILARFASDGTESITPIIEELARTGQTEPIMITRSGVTLNGNRRLSAMRELFEGGKHPKFASIECMVLPPLTPDQLDDIEDRLQMRPETKLPYTWANDAIRVRKRLAAKQGKEAAVAHLMRREKADIKKAIAALALADIYLKEWRHAPYDYRLVEDGRQFFYDLPARLKGKEGPLLEANMRMAWLLFDNRKTLGTRLYEFNKIVGEKAPEVLTKLAERVDLIADEPKELAETEDFEIDLGPGPEDDKYGPLIKTLDDEDRREDVLEELRVVCQSLADAGKADKLGKSALNAARDANTRLSEIDLSLADPKTYGGIDNQLAEVISRASNLRTKLKEIASKATETTA